MKQFDLANLQGEFKRRMRILEKNMEQLVRLIQTQKENTPKVDDMV